MSETNLDRLHDASNSIRSRISDAAREAADRIIATHEQEPSHGRIIRVPEGHSVLTFPTPVEPDEEPNAGASAD